MYCIEVYPFQLVMASWDDKITSRHAHSLKEIRCPFSHWSMRHNWHISFGVIYTRAYFSIDDGFWGIAIPWRWLDSFHIGVWDMVGWFNWMCLYGSITLSLVSIDFFRWLDHDTDTCESLQRSLVILEVALYWGITLSLVIDLRDTSLHLGMIMSKCIFVEAYHFAWSFSHWDMLFL